MKQICCKIRIVEARSVIPITFCFVGVAKTRSSSLVLTNKHNDTIACMVFCILHILWKWHKTKW